MIETRFSLRTATRVFEKPLPIRRLWSYDTDIRKGRVHGDVAATLWQKSLQPIVYMDVIETSQVFAPLLVRRAKLGFASQGQVLTPEVLARYRVLRVASLKVTTTAKRTQGGDGPQCASVKGLSPVMNG